MSQVLQVKVIAPTSRCLFLADSYSVGYHEDSDSVILSVYRNTEMVHQTVMERHADAVHVYIMNAETGNTTDAIAMVNLFPVQDTPAPEAE